MSFAAKDGAWVSGTNVLRIDCSKCGTVSTSSWPVSERRAEELIKQHMREKHGGGYA